MRRSRKNPISREEIALVAGGVVAIGIIGYLVYRTTQPATAAVAAPATSQPVTWGQVTGTTAPPSLLTPGFQGQASGPAPVTSTTAPETDFTGTS